MHHLIELRQLHLRDVGQIGEGGSQVSQGVLPTDLVSRRFARLCRTYWNLTMGLSSAGEHHVPMTSQGHRPEDPSADAP